uniref:Uncharacterized protein n=1 Tax=Strigamia maritima TaxID=126957 RepID=T1JLR9_STRMM
MAFNEVMSLSGLVLIAIVYGDVAKFLSEIFNFFLNELSSRQRGVRGPLLSLLWALPADLDFVMGNKEEKCSVCSPFRKYLGMFGLESLELIMEIMWEEQWRVWRAVSRDKPICLSRKTRTCHGISKRE